MNKTVIVVVIVLVLLGVGYYLMKGSYAPSRVPTASPQTSAPAAASPDTVNISGFAFSPSTLTVKAGTTVTWTNQDSVGHNIKATAFNSQILQKGDNFTFTFNTKGTFLYSCGIHPTMVGTIIVE